MFNRIINIMAPGALGGFIITSLVILLSLTGDVELIHPKTLGSWGILCGCILICKIGIYFKRVS